MTDRRSGSSPHADPLPPQVDNDLRALRELSARDVAPLDRSRSVLRSRRPVAAPRWKELLMPITESLRRPWFATAAVVVLGVLGLLVPISYDRTTGHDVAITLGGMKDVSHVPEIAREIKSVLGAEHVAVKDEATSTGDALTFEAFVPATSKVNADASSQALARALSARGYAAHAVVTSRREHVSGSVYAYAKDLVIHVDTDGKSSAQIEAEIRQRLAEAGITNTTVSVTDTGKMRKVTVEAENHDPHATDPGSIQLQLTKNGQPMVAGGGFSVQIRRMNSPDGLTLQLNVTDGANSAAVTVPHADALSDAALQATVDSQLRSAEIVAKVTVVNGKVTVEKP